MKKRNNPVTDIDAQFYELPDSGGLYEVDGVVDRVVYANQESGYHVLELVCGSTNVTAVGEMPDIFEGERITATGRFITHRNFGKQFAIETAKRRLPDNREDTIRYLMSGAIKGIGPVLAERIVDRFGDETMRVLENDPMQLAEVNGISLPKARDFAEELMKLFDLRRTMLYLAEYGLRPSESLRAVKLLGDSTMQLVEENPYILCCESIGLDFARVDGLAFERGFLYDNDNRLGSGILHVLRHNLQNGHTCLPTDKLLEAAVSLLRCEPELATAALERLVANSDAVLCRFKGRQFCFLPEYYRHERFIADKITTLMQAKRSVDPVTDEQIDGLQEKNGIVYEGYQRQAIKTAFESGVTIITGGPGTGKTTILLSVLQLAQSRKLNVSLAAPTGRAAKRMSDVTGWDAMTIHRLLECKVGEGGERYLEFQRNEENKLKADMIVIDEASMCDTDIIAALLHAIGDDARLILVGDADQLPAVGAGNIMRDLCNSGKTALIRLTEIYRQAANSKIVVNAHLINSGKPPLLTRENSDFFFLDASTEEKCAKTVLDLCCRRLPQRYGWSPFTDIQLLTPSRKGVLGTFELNKRMQEILNPKSEAPQYEFEGFCYRIGDKIMQNHNNYDIMWTKDGVAGIGLYNGDCGIITAIDRQDSRIDADFDGRQVSFTPEQLVDLEPAYACTVHKSQGSEFEAVVIPVFPAYSEHLMYRNLLYTAVTRAKTLLVLVGDRQTLMKMVANEKKALRYTGLRKFLTGQDNEQ